MVCFLRRRATISAPSVWRAIAVIDEVLHYLTIDGARFRYDGALRGCGARVDVDAIVMTACTVSHSGARCAGTVVDRAIVDPDGVHNEPGLLF
ncbi:MAG: hypothetical protein J7479_03275 [Roseiflexus sp.]|jgi:hypothetical protein|nr:hypothetical protein [Roseiflexus sp.]